MTFPSADPDADPDPTTQITWPGARPRRTPAVGGNLPGDGDRGNEEGTTRSDASGGHAKKDVSGVESGKRRMSTWNLMTLSVSMAGAQIAWTVELGYVQLQNMH